MKQWMKENSYIAAFVGAFSLFAFYVAITDEKIEKYEHVVIEYGDNLWTLADEYRGKMSKEDWIVFVKKHNGLFDRELQVGQTISVPVEKDSAYIARLSELESNSVKVASDYR